VAFPFVAWFSCEPGVRRLCYGTQLVLLLFCAFLVQFPAFFGHQARCGRLYSSLFLFTNGFPCFSWRGRLCLSLVQFSGLLPAAAATLVVTRIVVAVDTAKKVVAWIPGYATGLAG